MTAQQIDQVVKFVDPVQQARQEYVRLATVYDANNTVFAALVKCGLLGERERSHWEAMLEEMFERATDALSRWRAVCPHDHLELSGHGQGDDEVTYLVCTACGAHVEPEASTVEMIDLMDLPV